MIASGRAMSDKIFVRYVLRSGAPFEIVGARVLPVRVDVVNFGKVEGIRMKGRCDETMNLMTEPLSAFVEEH